MTFHQLSGFARFSDTNRPSQERSQDDVTSAIIRPRRLGQATSVISMDRWRHLHRHYDARQEGQGQTAP